MSGDLPAIVLVPGFLGVNLARPGGTRLWLSLGQMLLGDLATDLRFDGAGTPLVTDGLLELVYTDLRAALSAAGLVVHAFPFDFRRSIFAAAADLAAFIDGITRSTGAKRFVLVAHSQGALVTALYPYVDPAWTTRVERSVFLGAPLSGTFDAVESALGTHALVDRLASLSLRDTPAQIGACMRTWPGLYSMLPDPELFEGGEAAYGAGAWASGFAPAQGLLDEAREVRRKLKGSPLFHERPCAQLLSLRYHTADTYVPGRVLAGPRTAPGDGTVPACTAGFGGIPAYHVDYPHQLLPLDPKAIRGIRDLAVNGTTDLERVSDTQCNARLETPEPSPLALAANLFQSGSTLARMAWLLAPPG
jgi:pimeloyl-ACP methyl ester carboxylesterase